VRGVRRLPLAQAVLVEALRLRVAPFGLLVHEEARVVVDVLVIAPDIEAPLVEPAVEPHSLRYR
jgi:hypothetical protein